MTKNSICLCPDVSHPSQGVTKVSSTLLTYVNEIKQAPEATTGSSPHVAEASGAFPLFNSCLVANSNHHNRKQRHFSIFPQEGFTHVNPIVE